MASVDFQKIHTPNEAKRLLRHCDREKRLTDSHTNKQIDKSATARNQQQFSYRESCKRYDDRIAELDRVPGANKRSNRVTAFGLEIPAPDGFHALSPEQKNAWFQMVLDECASFSGGSQNVVAWYIHRDEQHEYTDAQTGEQRTSREHMHAFVIPEIDGKLNGRQFSSRQRMIQLNNRIHERSENEFGLKFMTGSKKKSRQEVEDLKRQSELREEIDRLQEKQKALQEKQKALQAENDRMRQLQVNIYIERFRKKAKAEKGDFSGIFRQASRQSQTQVAKRVQTRLKRNAERGHEQFFKDIQKNGNRQSGYEFT